ncbi:MAG: peptidoglycan-binding protein [Patescibacteria group bacterium]|nr:peptidoglycan-binding protein [Patescibacteria group bacterium]
MHADRYLYTVDCTIRITSSGNVIVKAMDDAGNSFTQIQSGYVIDTTPPVVMITAPTLNSNDDITDTTIHVTDDNAIFAANVLVDASSTAFTHHYVCVQTDSKTVDCTIEIDTSGNVIVDATDAAHNTATQTQSGYILMHPGPSIHITPPTKISSSTITDTTIRVTDDVSVAASNVTVSASSTAGTSNFSCTQTDTSTVDCTIRITSSGNLVIDAVNGPKAMTEDVEGGYVIDTILPVVIITAPTLVSGAPITDTTIHVTDNNDVRASQVSIDAQSTVDTSNFVCTQTDSKTVDCTIRINSDGDLIVNAIDDAGNTATATQSGYSIVTSAPVISLVNATPSQTSVSIGWMTDSLSSTKVSYSPDTSYSAATTEIDLSPRVVSHTATISNLVACTTYHYKVVSTDLMGNTTTGTDGTFTTTGCAGGASVQNQSLGTITAGGGILSLTHGGTTITLAVPSGYAGTSNYFQIKALLKSTVLSALSTPTDMVPIGTYAYDLKALSDSQTELSSFAHNVSVTLGYSLSDILNVNENTLAIYHYTEGAWTPLSSCAVDTTARTVTCTASSFSTFALFGSAKGGAAYATPEGVVVSGGVRLPLDFAIDDGATSTSERVLALTLNADPNFVSWYAVSLDPQFTDVPRLPYGPFGTIVLPDKEGTYNVYVQYYSSLNIPSRIISHRITYQKAVVEPYLYEEEAPSFFPSTSTPTVSAPVPTETSTSSLLQYIPVFRSHMEIGSLGSELIGLQLFLKIIGVYHGPVTGYFGSLTQVGVQAFQKKYNIPQVGVVGPLTRNQLNKILKESQQ